MHHQRGREHAHAACAKSLEQGAVFEFTGDARQHAFALEPLVEPGTQGSVCRGQQHRHAGQ